MLCQVGIYSFECDLLTKVGQPCSEEAASIKVDEINSTIPGLKPEYYQGRIVAWINSGHAPSAMYDYIEE